jgi:hypothetical protein
LTLATPATATPGVTTKRDLEMVAEARRLVVFGTALYAMTIDAKPPPYFPAITASG